MLTKFLLIAALFPVIPPAGNPEVVHIKKPTMRMYICDDSRRPGRPQGNTLETPRARLIINESRCWTT